MNNYKIKQLETMLSHEIGNGPNDGYGARLSHWFGDSKEITLDAGAIRALIEYYKGQEAER